MKKMPTENYVSVQLKVPASTWENVKGGATLMGTSTSGFAIQLLEQFSDRAKAAFGNGQAGYLAKPRGKRTRTRQQHIVEG